MVCTWWSDTSFDLLSMLKLEFLFHDNKCRVILSCSRACLSWSVVSEAEVDVSLKWNVMTRYSFETHPCVTFYYNSNFQIFEWQYLWRCRSCSVDVNAIRILWLNLGIVSISDGCVWVSNGFRNVLSILDQPFATKDLLPVKLSIEFPDTVGTIDS